MRNWPTIDGRGEAAFIKESASDHSEKNKCVHSMQNSKMYIQAGSFRWNMRHHRNKRPLFWWRWDLTSHENAWGVHPIPPDHCVKNHQRRTVEWILTQNVHPVQRFSLSGQTRRSMKSRTQSFFEGYIKRFLVGRGQDATIVTCLLPIPWPSGHFSHFTDLWAFWGQYRVGISCFAAQQPLRARSSL